MNKSMSCLHSACRHSNEMKYGQILSICSSNPVDRAELPDAICGTECRHTIDTGVAICRIGSIEFITVANPSHVLVCTHGICNRKRIVSWDPENVLYPEFV